MSIWNRRIALGAASSAVLATALMISTSFAAEAPQGKVLTPTEVTAKLVDQGFKKVFRIEMEDGIYEVKARGADGKRVNLNVDPHTGDVLGKHKDWFAW